MLFRSLQGVIPGLNISNSGHGGELNASKSINIRGNGTVGKDANNNDYAIMLGVFMGIVPIWGYQMLATLFLAHVLKLNKVIAIVAANISIPPMIPFLLYGSYLTGCKVLNRPVELHLTNISFENVKSVLEQYLIGSVIFATACSILAGIITISLLTIYRRPKTT